QGEGRREHLVHDDREWVADSGVEQSLPLGDQRIELGKEIAHPSFRSSSTESTSWPTVSISACMFMVMRMSNSSSTDATKSITMRLSHSRSPAKVVASVRATPFLLYGAISLATLPN